MQTLFVRRVLIVLVLTSIAQPDMIAARTLAADDFSASLEPFLQQFCSDCHTNGGDEGGLSIDSLDRNLDDPKAFTRWELVFDRVARGEMPPRDADQPTNEQRRGFYESLEAPLIQAHANAKGTVLRRLNRREYQNTLNDLFGTSLDLESLLPKDGQSHEFDNVGESLSISMIQLQRYLEAIDTVMDAAIAKRLEPQPPIRKLANYAETREGERHIGSVWKQLDDGAVVFYKAWGYPTGMLRTANVREAGRYRIAVTGYAHQSDDPITFAIGATTFQRGADRPTFAYRSLPPGSPTTVEIEAWIDSNYMVELTPWGITDRDQAIRRNGIDSYEGPGLAILNVELEGPLYDEFPSRGHRLLFDGLHRVQVQPSNPRARRQPRDLPIFKIESKNLHDDVQQALHRVAAAAFRRSVSSDEVHPYLSLFEREHNEGATVEEAYRTAVAAIFCSPDFLFLHESQGRLDDDELASRLAYFLTRTLPDDELRAAAASGELSSSPEVLLAQTRRLLSGPHLERFVTDFTDAWLNLRDIDFTAPDKSLYPEFDAFLQDSMLRETRQYLTSMIAGNEGAANLVRSDYAMLNNRLAEHYGIEGVVGPEIRRIDLPPDSVRGGILSQASVLKVSANGTNTSPVVRGVWVLERLLGVTPPPPPAGIPGIEPDIRGASTLRELLDKHRNVESCRRCHQMIDPPGFALESFNPIGGWRTHYRSLGEGQRIDLQVKGQRVRYRIGPEVDPSGEIPDGKRFENYMEFRELLARDEEALARTLTKKLLTFATGRETGFSDRKAMDEIVRQAESTGFGVRDLIELVVLSDIFREK